MITVMSSKNLVEKKKKDLKEKISTLDYIPRLAVVTSSKDTASQIYVRKKKELCEELGIDFTETFVEADNKEELKKSLIDTIHELNMEEYIDGILVQSPVGDLSREDEIEIFNKILPSKDVDAFSRYSVSDLYHNKAEIISCTPQGILDLLDEYGIDIKGEHVVIIGRSDIVGKPLALALLNRDATVTICHSKSNNLNKICESADIIISAIGKPKFITPEIIGSKTYCIIDVGINRDENGKLCGDVDFNRVYEQWTFEEEILEICRDTFITPVPGGVGPMTVINVAENLVTLAENRRKKGYIIE